MKKNPPHPSSSTSRPAVTVALEFGAWLALALYFLLPPREAMSWGLDSSNYGSYAWMFATGRQFGSDTVAMTGPFGFLAYGHTYSGYLFFAYLVGDFLLKAAFAFLVLRIFRQIPAGVWRWLWLVALLVFLPSVDDLIYDVAVLLAAVALLNPASKKALDFTAAIAAFLLGFSGLMKGSHATLAGVSLAFVVLGGVLAGNRKRVLTISAIALATFVGGWLAAGQSLRNLPGYFQALSALTSGYNAVMGLDPEPRTLTAGLIVAGLLALALLLNAWVARHHRERLLLLLFFVFFSFLQWKHGFVRADGHVYMFFGFVAVFAPLLQVTMWTIDPLAGEQRKILLSAAAAGLAFLAAAGATSSFSAPRLGELLLEVPGKFERNVRYVAAPQKIQQQRTQDLQQQQQHAELSIIRRDVGAASIDFLGYEQGILLLNGLNYHPRPMGGGSFNVYHPFLQKLNGQFMGDASRRPDFFLLKFQSIDRRLPTADDPLTLQGLLAFYQPIRAQRDFVLFEKKPAADASSPRPLTQRTLTLGEWMPVPETGADELLLFSLDARPSLGGALRGIGYHPPLLMIDIVIEGGSTPETFRLSPLSAQVPVLLSPLLAHTSDVISLYDQKLVGKKVQQIRLYAPAGGFASTASVSFYALPIPVTAGDDAAAEISTYLNQPWFNRTPLAVSTQETGIIELFDEPITLVHAPGSITFPVEANDQQFIFSFGLMPQAYDPGETDGVEFIVEYLHSDHPPQLLFSQLLQPRTVAKDRGMQSARVFFPPQIPPGVVRLRTERGPAGNGAWDQSYVAHVQIKPGAFDPRQLTGISVAPEAPGFPDPNPTLVEGRAVRVVLPPGELRFPVPPASRFVTIGVGVLPAAYTGENHSDGIGCDLVIVRPDGSQHPLASRTLNPARDWRARGTVTLDIPLPELPEGSRLLMKLNGGPKEDLRWDWSYVETVRFR